MKRRSPGIHLQSLAGMLCAASMLLSQPADSAVSGPGAGGTPTLAPPPAQGFAANSLTYADLVDLADHSPSVLHVMIRKVVPVEPARAPGVRPGWVRMYVEARPLALLAGPPLPADSLRYLVDVPLDAKGKPPKLPRLAKRGVILLPGLWPSGPGNSSWLRQTPRSCGTKRLNRG